MRLKNKKTGEIGYFCFANWNDPVLIIMDNNGIQLGKYSSLAELNKEWQDYEKPKEYWYIDDGGVIQIDQVLASEINMRKSIGNYFESKEEAEKAVEKLKAWKRLKDKGFKYCGHDDRDRGQLGDIVIYAEMPTFEYDDDSTRDDLDLLFSQEDD